MGATASPSPAELGAHVRRLRLQQGLSLADFARRSELEPNDVEQLEAGHSDFDTTQLRAVSRGLGMELSAIFRIWETSALTPGDRRLDQ